MKIPNCSYGSASGTRGYNVSKGFGSSAGRCSKVLTIIVIVLNEVATKIIMHKMVPEEFNMLLLEIVKCDILVGESTMDSWTQAVICIDGSKHT
ncbi:hypothetical protein HAX54_036538 [Datura stramonium]|uniref:Uncharacterized protein n=1 Tax=Datura stramonium TaxID=4076 RepID=A0ABS8SG72_DATST|nr:hypothetical protein [Datura stramonium]